jgi:hypothetical protein
VTDEWTRLAESASDDDLREKILTGFKDGKPFSPYVPTLTLPSPLARLLDFGCGLGRNVPYLKTIASHVTGFDLPAMIPSRSSTTSGPTSCASSARCRSTPPAECPIHATSNCCCALESGADSGAMA